jgi:hypothetical protein
MDADTESKAEIEADTERRMEPDFDADSNASIEADDASGEADLTEENAIEEASDVVVARCEEENLKADSEIELDTNGSTDE